MISEWSRMDFQTEMKWAKNIGQFIVMNIQRGLPWAKVHGQRRMDSQFTQFNVMNMQHACWPITGGFHSGSLTWLKWVSWWGVTGEEVESQMQVTGQGSTYIDRAVAPYWPINWQNTPIFTPDCYISIKIEPRYAYSQTTSEKLR